MEAPLDAATATECCIQCGLAFCSTCGTCETETCPLMGQRTTTKSDMKKVRHLLVQSQKIKGYSALAMVGLPVPSPYKVVAEEDEIPSALKYFIGEVFVRPCPVRPRHGFVESRKVPVSPSEVLKIWKEARAADEHAELLLCAPIAATHNLIITPTRMAVGCGNDGATAGVSTLTVPLAGVPFHEVSPKMLKGAAVDAEKEDPYIEVVILNEGSTAFSIHGSGNEVYFTQLRAGVKLPNSIGENFIPKAIKVESIVRAAGDLLEWEKQMQTLKPGAVVTHVGGTLISHYGVHCMQNNIPCMTSREPEIGETLTPTAPIVKPDPQAVITGLGAGALVPIVHEWQKQSPGTLTTSQASLIVIVTMHNSAAMAGRDGYWLGIATSLMLRLGMAASHGEARHSDSARKALGREYVYRISLTDMLSSREELGITQYLFKNHSWVSGFGGQKWAACTQALFDMDAAAQGLFAEPTEEKVADLVLSLNKAVNQAHNNGWWLNKFVNQEAFTYGSSQSLRTLGAVGPAFWQVEKFGRKGAEVAVEKWKTAGEIKIPEAPPTPEPAIAPYPMKDKITDAPIMAAKAPANFTGCGDPTCTDCALSEVQQVTGPPVLEGAKAEQFKEVTKKVNETLAAPAAVVQQPKEAVQPKPYTTPKLNGTSVKGPVQISAAHGRFGKTKSGVHVQFILASHYGYFSFDFDEVPPIAKDWFAIHKSISYSGSGTNYAKLDVELVEGTVWKFTQPDSGRTFNFDIAECLGTIHE